jgi:L-seryl-tRNA(Ser) seleniumtransferase
VADRHDIAVFNRLTAAIFATHLALVKPGQTVVGIAPTYSHPVVVRAAMQTGGRFVDTKDFDAFAAALDKEPEVGLVTVTRLAVSYDLLPLDVIRKVVRLAHDRGVKVLVDDAGGARVGPAIFEQPRMLELGVDVGATGLDKYGTVGPRLGLLAGESSLVEAIRARGFEFGLEARPMLYPAVVRSLEGYSPARVRELVACTKQVGAALKARLGGRIRETPVTAQLPAEDILEIAMARAGLSTPPVVPYEAKASLAMLLLEDYGVLSVHFAGLPPGNANFLFKFVPPETLAAFGGPERFAEAVDHSLAKLARLIGEPENVRALLFGDA